MHKNRFGEVTMEKCVLDIKLMNMPRTRDFECKNNTNRGEFEKWVECVFNVYANLLRFTINQKASFITFKGPMSVKFMAVNPQATYNVSTIWTWY